MIKRELKLFFTALSFFTRVPVAKYADISYSALNESSRYFTLTGCVVGGFGALVFYGSHFILPVSVSVIISTVATILLTGAFHEDAIADVCDGFGGGMTRERILEIMKDSRTGAFGVTGLTMVLLTKIFCLMEMPASVIPAGIIAGHSLSRFASAVFMYTHKYVRDDDSAKSKPMAETIGLKGLVFSAFCGITPIFFFNSYHLFLAVIPVLLTEVTMARYFRKKIGGYTGDCLGAVQQVSEAIFYISILAIIFISKNYIF